MVRRAAARRRRAIFFGFFVFVFFIALTGLSLVSTQGLPFAPRTTVQAAFQDIGSLRTGDDVRIANVRVGYVESVHLRDTTDPNAGQAKEPVAILRLDNERPVYQNAKALTASVGARSALGQKFVELNPGDPSAGLLAPDAVIPAAKTVGAQELSDVLAVLDVPTRQAIGSVVRNVGGGLAGHGHDFNLASDAFPDALPDLGTVSLAFANNGGRDTASLLRSTNDLSVSFAGRQEQIGQLLGKMDKTFAGFNADRGQALEALLKTAPDSLRTTKAALLKLDPALIDTSSAVKELRPGGKALGEATPDFRGFLQESPEPLDKVPGVADDARPALGDLRETFDDLQPLAPMLTKGFARGAPTADKISPYMPEVAGFFTNISQTLTNGNNNYRWLTFILTPQTPQNQATDLIGVVGDPTSNKDPYPAPGEAGKQRTGVPGLNTNGVPGR
ncbi:MlaD family protein [Pseudonocardia eucalypti]|uniref:MlaD family protein n=1 Tax=Pseudonocardia eucalypti TaxID=648755 RepID=A0ABP9R276_9PSEU|nr:phospholipid/cholesterol/gamma-HCH transport system substrate-binding protein [Pseudonocardia eucalypti]